MSNDLDRELDPELDLTIERVIRAPRAAIWRAWTDPEQLVQWFLPAPATLRADAFEARAGGPIRTSMAEPGGDWTGHLDACFVAVDELERIVFTTALDAALRPAASDGLRMTADITLADHPDGTTYRVVVRHADPAMRARHEELGFADGWGQVTSQLAALVEDDGTGG